MTYHRNFNTGNTTGVNGTPGTVYHSKALAFTTVLSGVHLAQSKIFGVVFRRSLFVILSFFVWPLYYLSFDLRFLITPLVSSNFPFELIYE
jgi:hypothetical protein